MQRFLSGLFDGPLSATPVNEGGDPSPAAFWLKSFVAGLIISAPAWASRVAAFLF
jgi:hypothetical protein